MTTFVSLVNKVLVRLNEVPVDSAGDGFDSVRNVQALAKEAVNTAVRIIIQDGQEWPFLKVTQTQVLTDGVSEYDFADSVSSVDWETFYLKKSTSLGNQAAALDPISYEEYIKEYRHLDDNNDTGSVPTRVYQTFEDKFGITPKPNGAYEVEYVSWTFPSDMSSYSDICVIPSRFDHVIVDGAMMILMRFRSNEQSADVHQKNFEDGVRAMRRVLMDDELVVRSTVISGRS